VLAQTSSVHSELRLRRFKFVGGENGTATTHRELGFMFPVDVEKVYFSPRLSHERMRIAEQVGKVEVVLTMFAGAGCFSILIVKYSKAEKVSSIDANSSEVRYIRENIRLNRVYGTVSSMLGDSQEIVERNLRHTTEFSCLCLRKPMNTCLKPCRLLKRLAHVFNITILNMARKETMPLGEFPRVFKA
jgi:tRNA G37 N-methylase Trm5